MRHRTARLINFVDIVILLYILQKHTCMYIASFLTEYQKCILTIRFCHSFIIYFTFTVIVYTGMVI